MLVSPEWQTILANKNSRRLPESRRRTMAQTVER
jgi:hypothetical protein